MEETEEKIWTYSKATTFIKYSNELLWIGLLVSFSRTAQTKTYQVGKDVSSVGKQKGLLTV